ncbi:hypothetical protein SAY87_028618 [Trapa incisa]|uniref:CCHC-type domain-containing protein n=1 Tax=Trapa incisa TaxID=236973 RepID=A0AAN7QNV7_9MYRT|nr:hypothetical protein SAY87_028618 [Trapa incisa]
MVGRRKKKKEAKHDFEESEGGEILAQLRPEAIAGSSSDDDEANEDLSLKIVEKALLKRAATLTPVPFNGIVSDDDDEADFNIEAARGVVDLGESGESEEVEEEVHELESQEQLTVSIEDEEKDDTVEATDAMNSVDPNPVDVPDNITLRKLLRGPRYFDPPDNSWGRCYNCGEEGHAAAKCSQKRKRPCFLCGSLEHNAKDCSKVSCFICKSVSHRAKDCPEKKKHGSQKDEICLKCANSGHDMFHCLNDYSPEDLKGIQCYICKNFGHLCCIDPLDMGKSEISCYKCGLLGHSGLACGRLRASKQGEATPSSCYKCGEEGHFARECKVSKKVSTTSLNGGQGEAILNPCYKCGQEGHFARECTVSNKRITSLLDSQGDATPRSCYKCGQVGHFARECSFGDKWSQDKATPSLCRRCGQEGHIARECRFSNKLQQRNQEPSTPISRFHSDDMDYIGLNSPNNSKNLSKRKKYEDTEGSATMPRTVKQRGRWECESAGASQVKSHMKNTGRVSSWTPSNGSGPYGNTHSPWNSHKFHSGDSSQSRFSWNQQRFHDEDTSQSRFSRFGKWRGDSTSRNDHWW